MSPDTSGTDRLGPTYVDVVRRFFELLSRKKVEAWGEL
jgi:hypothetical protein